MFKTVDDLVHYRYMLSPETMTPAWFKMIYQGAIKYKPYPRDTIIRSALFSIENHGKLKINFPIPFSDLTYLFDLFSADEKLSKHITSFLILNFDHQHVLRIIGAHNRGVCILRAGLEQGYFWDHLMMSEEELSEDIVACLREYNESNGCSDLSIPFSSKDIRDNNEILSKIGSMSNNYYIFARIVKAFSDAHYQDMPVLDLDYHEFLRYLMKNTHCLSTQQFARFLKHLKVKVLFQWVESEDNSFEFMK
jgi:hypothetical protein